MPNVVQTLRSITPGQRPAGRAEGELYVNLPDKQFGMVDDTGAPVDLGAVRHWSALAAYVIGDLVAYEGQILRCEKAHTAAAFNPFNWNPVTKEILNGTKLFYVETTGDDVTGDGSQTAPWATLARASTYLRGIEINSWIAELRIGVGSFVGTGFFNVAGQIDFIGAGIDQTIITPPYNDYCFNIYGTGSTAAYVTFRNMTLVAGDNYANYGAITGYGVRVALGYKGIGLAFDATVKSGALISLTSSSEFGTDTLVEIRQGGIVPATPTYMLQFYEHSMGSVRGAWTLVGPPNTYAGWLRLGNNANFTQIGSITGTIIGKKFHLTEGSQAWSTAPPATSRPAGSDGWRDTPDERGETVPLDINTFPGDQPGTWDASSFYDGVQGGAPVAPPDLSGYLPLTGGTISPGPLILPAGDQVIIDGPNGSQRTIVGKTSGVKRWEVALGNEFTEPGDGSGSSFMLIPFTDAGAPDTPLLLAHRATHAVEIVGALDCGKGWVNGTLVGLPATFYGPVTFSSMPSIPGGTAGAVLTTDGAGTLTWGVNLARVTELEATIKTLMVRLAKLDGGPSDVPAPAPVTPPPPTPRAPPPRPTTRR